MILLSVAICNKNQDTVSHNYSLLLEFSRLSGDDNMLSINIGLQSVNIIL